MCAPSPLGDDFAAGADPAAYDATEQTDYRAFSAIQRFIAFANGDAIVNRCGTERTPPAFIAGIACRNRMLPRTNERWSASARVCVDAPSEQRHRWVGPLRGHAIAPPNSHSSLCDRASFDMEQGLQNKVEQVGRAAPLCRRHRGTTTERWGRINNIAFTRKFLRQSTMHRCVRPGLTVAQQTCHRCALPACIAGGTPHRRWAAVAPVFVMI